MDLAINKRCKFISQVQASYLEDLDELRFFFQHNNRSKGIDFDFSKTAFFPVLQFDIPDQSDLIPVEEDLVWNFN